MKILELARNIFIGIAVAVVLIGVIFFWLMGAINEFTTAGSQSYEECKKHYPSDIERCAEKLYNSRTE